MEPLAELKRTAAKEGVSNEVIERGPARRIVEIASAEEALVVEQIDRDIAPGDDRLEDAGPCLSFAQRHAEGAFVAPESL
jgi:hypothetical protein